MGHWGAGTWWCLGTELQGHRGVWGQGRWTQGCRDTGNKRGCWGLNTRASSPCSPHFHSTHHFFPSFQPSVDGSPLPIRAVPGEKPPSRFSTPRLGFSWGGAGKAPKTKDWGGWGEAGKKPGSPFRAHVAPKDQPRALRRSYVDGDTAKICPRGSVFRCSGYTGSTGVPGGERGLAVTSCANVAVNHVRLVKLH